MFWTNIYALSPHIEALLKKEDVTLHELMDQEEIVPECRSQNKKLVDYLSRPDIMQELVTLTTKEPSEDMDERSRYKYPNVACELLTCNVPSLNEKLASDEVLLEKLYSFIDTDEPLNPLLASFFSKTIGVLLTRRSDQNWYSYQFMCLQVLEYLKNQKQCVDRLLQHLETSAIMDLVLKLVTKVEGSDMRQNVLSWLDSQQLVQQLIKLLSPTSEPARHANAAQLLCDMIKLARYFRITCTERTDPDPILNTLESEETVSLLLKTILTDEPMESSIVGGIQVLLVLLGHETNNIANEGDMQGNSAGEETTDDEGRVKIQNATLAYLELLQILLLNPPPKPPVRTTAGLLTSPLGNTRLHVAKLLVALLYTENIEIFRKLSYLGTFQILLDLFFKYSWNNFLHTQVEQCLASVINGDWKENSETVYTHIFVECRLIERLLEAWDKNENKQNAEKQVRQGYMGHLINIVNNIVKECTKNEFLDAFLKTNPSPECAKKWEELVTTEFVKINKIHQLSLGGKSHPYMCGSDDPNEDYNPYDQDAYIQQVYANYQGQQMTPNFTEHCGFHDDEFNDRDDALHNSIDQLTTMPFTLNEEDLDKGEEMFNKICQQRQKAGLDESGGGVEWGDEGELTFQTVIDKRDWPSKQQHHDSNSSDEDEDPRESNMEIDSTDPWGSTEPLPSNSVLPRVNPWDVDPAAPAEQSGWANFDNFDSTLNDANFDGFENELLNIAGLKVGDEAPTSEQLTSTSPTTVGVESAIPAVPVVEAAVPMESASHAETTVAPVVEAEEKPVQIQAEAKNAESTEKVESSIPQVVAIEKQTAAGPEEQKITQAQAVTEQPTPKVEETTQKPTNKTEVIMTPETSKAETVTEKSTPKVEETTQKPPIKTEVINEPEASKAETVQETAGQSTNVSASESAIPEASTKVEVQKKTEETVKIQVPKESGDSEKAEVTTKVDELEKQEKPLTML